MVTNLKTALPSMPVTNIAETDLIELLYQDKTGPLTVDADILEKYLQGCTELGQPPSFYKQDIPESIEDALKTWNIPEHYQALDLDIYFAEKVKSVEEAVRVSEELALFRERGLEPMLRFMIYLVQVMRDNNIVWGVGRGSSVSSFLLFLTGLHQVDSVKYKLDIKEFIR
jgi:DNA polymerase III alpha subunit